MNKKNVLITSIIIIAVVFIFYYKFSSNTNFESQNSILYTSSSSNLPQIMWKAENKIKEKWSLSEKIKVLEENGVFDKDRKFESFIIKILDEENNKIFTISLFRNSKSKTNVSINYINNYLSENEIENFSNVSFEKNIQVVENILLKNTLNFDGDKFSINLIENQNIDEIYEKGNSYLFEKFDFSEIEYDANAYSEYENYVVKQFKYNNKKLNELPDKQINIITVKDAD